MKNKTIILVLLALLMIPAAAFSDTGLGAAFTYGVSDDDNNTGGALSINTPAIPGTVQNLRLAFKEDYFSFSITDDWWVVQENLTGLLDLYIGIGFFGSLTMDTSGDDTETNFGLGARVPVGLTIMPSDFLEIFMEVAPAMGLGFEPEIYFPAWYVQGALGLRVWF
ncbi:MAG: hypothetical protein B6241_12775 [Spirochaetaceae bacterium 4572_59]|nr:MAG: hypothetical protein B6241_12775 [Spirochaetaceae bacterium 4572_59]